MLSSNRSVKMMKSECMDCWMGVLAVASYFPKMAVMNATLESLYLSMVPLEYTGLL